MLPQPPIAYSALLQEFVSPLITEDETEETFLQRCRFGMSVWNYYVCKKYRLKMLPIFEDVILAGVGENADYKAVVELLLERKGRLFDQYDNIILRIKKKITPNGDVNLRVESVPWFIIDGTSVSNDIATQMEQGVKPGEIVRLLNKKMN